MQVPTDKSTVAEKIPNEPSPDENINAPKKNTGIPSVDEILLKKEEELELARGAIKTLNNDLGTIFVTESFGNNDDSSFDTESVHAEVDQNDSLFAHQYIFQTNVRN